MRVCGWVRFLLHVRYHYRSETNDLLDWIKNFISIGFWQMCLYSKVAKCKFSCMHFSFLNSSHHNFKLCISKIMQNHITFSIFATCQNQHIPKKILSVFLNITAPDGSGKYRTQPCIFLSLRAISALTSGHICLHWFLYIIWSSVTHFRSKAWHIRWP